VNYSDPFGLKAEDVFIGCRNLDEPLDWLGQHCAIKIVDGSGREEVYELINNKWRNDSGQPSTAEQISKYKYTAWSRVDVPDGMSSAQFDEAVRSNAVTLGGQRNGLRYLPFGGRNSNRFVYDAITSAGGEVSLWVADTVRLVPGLCGGIGLFRGRHCRW
jgi:hypothetical protein